WLRQPRRRRGLRPDRRCRERAHHPVRRLAGRHRTRRAPRAHPRRPRRPPQRPLRPPDRGACLMSRSDAGAAVEPTAGPAGVPPAGPAAGAVPLHPPMPRSVLLLRTAIGVVLAVAALAVPFMVGPTTNRVLSEAVYIA